MTYIARFTAGGFHVPSITAIHLSPRAVRLPREEQPGPAREMLAQPRYLLSSIALAASAVALAA